MSPRQLPYISMALARSRNDDEEFERAFSGHIHWGVWPEPQRADTAANGYAEAAGRLTKLAIEAAGIQDGMRVLDAGCGLGGGVVLLNEDFSGLHVTGLDVDASVIDHARRRVAETDGNKITFVVGDAVSTPAPPRAFDAILAIESLPYVSRKRFFREAARLLVPGGRLALADFLLVPRAVPRALPALAAVARPVFRFFGRGKKPPSLAGYTRIGSANGFELETAWDLTAQAMPTFESWIAMTRDQRGWPSNAAAAIRGVERVTRMGVVRYYVLGFRLHDDDAPKRAAVAD